MKSLLAAWAAVVLYDGVCAFAQERPPAQIVQRPGGGTQVEWRLSGTGELLRYQLEQSADLRLWTPIGTPLRSASTEGRVSRQIDPTEKRSFYRVALVPETRNSVLALGGADVFGYSDLFAEALKEIGQIRACY